jgi:hypothetical protein
MSFYWVVANIVLPAADRWEAAIQTYSRQSGSDELTDLPKTLYWRLYQVLKARDRLLATCSVVPIDHTPADEILTDLEQILLWLMAAFDIVAQVAHVSVGVRSMRIRNAMWQFREWLDKVGELDPRLAALVQNNNPGEHLLSIVTALRNSIHGLAMSSQGVIYLVGDEAMSPLVHVPQKKRNEIIAAMEELGGQDKWGIVRPFPDADLHLHTGEFVEQLLPRCFSLLNDLIRLTPVDGLSGVDATRLPTARPRSLAERRALWQLGQPA